MRGLTGIISDVPIASGQLDRMVSALVQERSDCIGRYVDECQGIHLGWVTRDGASADRLPVWNERRDTMMLFVGENFMDSTEMRRLGVDAREPVGSQPRVLLTMYEALGPQFIEHLNGWFHGVVVDLRHRLVIMFNDRFALRRVYYHEQEGRFHFASQAKSLLQALPALRRVDQRGAAETLSLGCVLQNRTLFDGVHLLPPGARWTFARPGPLAKERYFDPASWEGQAALDDGAYGEEVTATFARVLPKYIRAEGRVGASLTAGLDSRMIMAWADAAPGRLPCYSFSGTYRESVDVKVGRHVARVCQQPHETIGVDGAFLDGFGELAQRAVYLSDGTMDVTGAVELFVNRIAASIAPVRVTGNYGSEILRGNVAFRPARWTESSLHEHVLAGMRRAEETYAVERAVPTPSFVAFKQMPWHHFARLSIEQSQLEVRSPFLDNELVALTYRAPRGRAMNNEEILRLVAKGNAELAAIPSDRGDALPAAAAIARLRRAYRSLEIRAEYAFDYGMPPWLARVNHALAPLRLERAFLGRHKFYHFRVWYRDRLHAYVRDVLLDPRTRQRSFFTAEALDRMVIEHGQGAANWTREITRALTFELTQRTLIDQ